jgi:hypothetical protein
MEVTSDITYRKISHIDLNVHCSKILWRTDPLLGNDRQTNNETTAVALKRSVHQWTSWKVVFLARSASMAPQATMECFLCGEYLDEHNN